MSELTDQEESIIKSAHDERDRWIIREERREVYQMVAESYCGCIVKNVNAEWVEDKDVLEQVQCEAEAIYQGMLKFVGDKT